MVRLPRPRCAPPNRGFRLARRCQTDRRPGGSATGGSAAFTAALNTLPGGIDGTGATPRGRGQVMRKLTCPRTRTRPPAWGVAPVTAGAARVASAGLFTAAENAAAQADTRAVPVRIAERRKCASAPHVVCALQYGSKSRAAHRLARLRRGVTDERRGPLLVALTRRHGEIHLQRLRGFVAGGSGRQGRSGRTRADRGELLDEQRQGGCRR